MSWERKALETMILKSIEMDKEFSKRHKVLSDLGVELNIDNAAYQILGELSDEWDFFAENLEAVHDGDLSKDDFVSVCLEYIESKFNN